MIEFKDIRVGDKIRHTRRTDKGGKVTLEFKVDTVSSFQVEGEGLTAFDYKSMSTAYPEWSFELLERVEPEEWILLGIRNHAPEKVKLINSILYTKARVDEVVAELNEEYPDNKYWAVKVDASAK